jgi:hypothetical protein
MPSLKNAGVDKDDMVYVSKAFTSTNVPSAEKVVLRPVEPVTLAYEFRIRDILNEVPITVYDEVMIPYLGRTVSCKVVGYTPKSEVVVIKEKTRFQILGQG